MRTVRWLDRLTLEVDGTAFAVHRALSSSHGDVPDALIIVKPPELVDRYVELLDRERPCAIVELGVREGGSTALLALVADPEVLLALDLEPEIPPRLEAFVRERGLGDRVVTRFGTDQSDVEALRGFVDGHRPDVGFDLVIDDASHSLGPTRASFEVLFPRLRPGGTYIVEDWASDWEAANFLVRAHGGESDVGTRLRRINYAFNALNTPTHEYPSDLLEAINEAAARAFQSDAATAPRSFLESVAAALDDPAIAARVARIDGDAPERTRPLSDLAVELMLIRAAHPDLLAEVYLDGDWLLVRRGEAPLPLDGFRLADQWIDAYGYLDRG